MIAGFPFCSPYIIMYVYIYPPQSTSAKLAYLRLLARAAVVATGVSFLSTGSPGGMESPIPVIETINDVSLNTLPFFFGSALRRSCHPTIYSSRTDEKKWLACQPHQLLFREPNPRLCISLDQILLLFLTFSQVKMIMTQPDLPRSHIQWADLKNMEYLAQGGTSRIYTADLEAKRVIAKVGRLDFYLDMDEIV